MLVQCCLLVDILGAESTAGLMDALETMEEVGRLLLILVKSTSAHFRLGVGSYRQGWRGACLETLAGTDRDCPWTTPRRPLGPSEPSCCEETTTGREKGRL